MLESSVVRWSTTIGALALFLAGVASVIWGTSADVPDHVDALAGLLRMVFVFFVCVVATVLGGISLATWVKFLWDRHHQGY